MAKSAERHLTRANKDTAEDVLIPLRDAGKVDFWVGLSDLGWSVNVQRPCGPGGHPVKFTRLPALRTFLRAHGLIGK